MATSVTLTSIIGTVTAATGYRYGVRDSVGNPMDTMKVIDSPDGGYLRIFHTGDAWQTIFTRHECTMLKHSADF